MLHLRINFVSDVSSEIPGEIKISNMKWLLKYSKSKDLSNECESSDHLILEEVDEKCLSLNWDLWLLVSCQIWA